VTAIKARQAVNWQHSVKPENHGVQMYPQHFGLSGRPFTGGPGSQFLVPNAQVASAVAHLQDALLSRDAVVLVSGGPGVGKSALLEHARQGAEDQAVVAWADLRQCEPEQLFDALLLSLGEAAGDGSGADSWHRLREAVGRHNAEGRSVSAAIDVNGITVERAKRLLRLAYLMGEPGSQLNLLLQGPHTLHKLLDVPGLISLRQRVVFRYRVRPLSQTETMDYLVQGLQAAGGDAQTLCNADVARKVYAYVAGVPRLINTLMEAALTEAAARQEETLTEEVVVGVANGLGWKPMGRRQARRPAAAQAASAAPARPTPPGQAGPTKTDAAPSANRPAEAEITASPDAAAQATHSDLTAALLAPVELTIESDTNVSKEKTPEPEDAATEPPAAYEPPPGVPEMDPSDTSATGMLRLEDLDDRFAESVFAEGEEPSAA